MSDQPKSNRPLSEISHLFLSSVRDRQTNGASRPVRRPPGSHEVRQEVSIDLTPEEFEQVFGAVDAVSDADAPGEAAVHSPRITAVLSAHLNGSQHERVRQYARHLASAGKRIGLLEVDTHEFRLMCFDCGTPGGGDEADSGTECFDARKMAEAIEEINWDVDRWLLVLPNPRTPEARALLREVDHWAMLSTCDHDGVVSCYRMLKGLSDLHRPRLTLGLLDVHDESQASRVFAKLSTVCSQFLHWPLTAEPSIERAEHVAEHVVMLCCPTRDKAQLASAPQWQIAAEFLAKIKSPSQEAPMMTSTLNEPQISHAIPQPAPAPKAQPSTQAPRAAHVADVVVPMSPQQNTGARREPVKELPATPPVSMRAVTDAPVSDVIDLTDGVEGSASIITAIIRNAAGELIECPVRPPMCPDARLTIDRDRQLVLLAVAGEGLSDLRSIAQAYRWLMENRALVAMALPQFAIDAMRAPRLRLLVDHADVSAELLQPMLQSGNVTVQAYRKIRWGAKLGLLLEAA
jgi:hypothetical protein